MTHADPLHLDEAERRALWHMVGDAIEDYYRDVRQLRADRQIDVTEVRAIAEGFDFDHPTPPDLAIARAVGALRDIGPHVLHPRHFGLFDPAPTAMGVLGQAVVAAFNPCLASWASSPFGVEAERYLVRVFGELFGYEAAEADGVVTSGGSESNLTGLLLALEARFPGHRAHGQDAAAGRPVVYATRHAHPSILKAAAITGLGTSAVREVPSDRWCRMDPVALDRLIRADLAAGRLPLLVLVTAGTTDAGAMDPIGEVTELAAGHGVWVHLDAAWGGAAALVPEVRGALDGAGRADSLAFDPHKWLSVPMGCGLLLTRHPSLLDQAFGVTAAFLAEPGKPGIDPYARSIRWSRDFAGLTLLLSLAVAGWDGYRQALRRQVLLARRLRERLARDGWAIVNDTPLPVVCFSAGHAAENEAVASAVNQSGQARIFTIRLSDQVVLRACITNFATTANDIDVLVDILSRARSAVQSGHSLHM